MQRVTKKNTLRRHLGPHCLRCGATDNLTIDHVIPRARGGRNESTNLQTLCGDCNSWKGFQPHDFRDQDLPTQPGVKRDNEAYRRGRLRWRAAVDADRGRLHIVYTSERTEPLDDPPCEAHIQRAAAPADEMRGANACQTSAPPTVSSTGSPH